MEDDSEQCLTCGVGLTPPYIRCKQCPDKTHICLPCFARGAEAGIHQNNHSYSVVRYDFPLYENNWTAAEELNLLGSMETQNYGNWSDISVQLKNKTPSDCEQHYNKCYISNPKSPLPKFPEYEPDIVPMPMLFKLSDNPPRPPEGSPLSIEMGGYSAPRGEFTVEFNNFAELDVCQMTFEEKINTNNEEYEDEEDANLMNDMKMAILHSYRQTLKERHRRKRVVKDYGLINLQKIIWYQMTQMDREVVQTLNNMQVFTCLMSPVHNDLLHEALIYEQELRDRISLLQEYRRNGLRRHHSLPMYKMLHSRRSVARTKRHLLSDVVSHIRDDMICQTWLQRQGIADVSNKLIPLPSAPRRAAPRLKIDGMPGYERLSPSERELCETVRFLPEAYQEFSSLLINEAHKHGGLRLAQARTLIKIDVNKTRKLYNYLVQEGRINQL